MAKQNETPGLGSVSSGTMRVQDLIPAFMGVLEQYAPEKAETLKDDHDEIFAWLDADEDEQDNEPDVADDADIFLNESLWDALSELAPPFVYFGSNPGDGADYGFWPSIESIDEAARFQDGLIKVSAGDEWPEDLDGIDYVAEVNDHGNITLFDANTEEEIWSAV